MSNEKLGGMRPVDVSDSELLNKACVFISGERTVEQQVELVQGGAVIFIDILRSLKGDEFVAGFLTAAIKDIKSGSKPIFQAQPMTTH